MENVLSSLGSKVGKIHEIYHELINEKGEKGLEESD